MTRRKIDAGRVFLYAVFGLEVLIIIGLFGVVAYTLWMAANR